jgi:hypothetical protein
MAAKSENINRVRGHPDVELLKARLQALFEIAEERQTLREVGNIDEQALKLVAIGLAFVTPVAANGCDSQETAPKRS